MRTPGSIRRSSTGALLCLDPSWRRPYNHGFVQVDHIAQSIGAQHRCWRELPRDAGARYGLSIRVPTNAVRARVLLLGSDTHPRHGKVQVNWPARRARPRSTSRNRNFLGLTLFRALRLGWRQHDATTYAVHGIVGQRNAAGSQEALNVRHRTWFQAVQRYLPEDVRQTPKEVRGTTGARQTTPGRSRPLPIHQTTALAARDLLASKGLPVDPGSYHSNRQRSLKRRGLTCQPS